MIPTLTDPMGISFAGRRLQYIESTGTQYINTGVKPDFANGDSVEIRVYKSDGSGNMCLFGSRQTPALNGFYALGQTLVSCDASGYASAPFLENGFISMSVDDAYIRYGDTEIAQTKRVTCAYQMYLFALNNGGIYSGMKFYSGMKLYDWKYYHNGVLAQHLIPVLDRSGVPCLYDTVTRTLKYNAGTGTFNYA